MPLVDDPPPSELLLPEDRRVEALEAEMPVQVDISTKSLAQLFSFSFGNGVLLSSYFIITLPIESKRIAKEESAGILGGFILIAGVTQLICPIIGLISDRTEHKWGKRRPYILFGGMVGVAGLLLQLISRSYEYWYMYLLAFTISMFALNVIYSCMNGFVSDVVPDEQIGRANGVIAMLSVCGAVSSFAVFSILSSLGYSLTQFYMFYMTIIGGTCILTFIKGGELEARYHSGYQVQTHSGDLWSEVKKAFYLSPVLHRDFFLILISRTFYYMGVSSQTFLMYYVRDMLGLSEADSETFTSSLAVIGQFCGVFTAFPVGYLSDRLLNGRRAYIYVSCIIMAMGNLALLGAGSKTSVIVITGLVGAANGAYLTMDGSLAFDALPNKEETARFMGIWGVGAFIGTALGPTIGGPVLMMNIDAGGEGYTMTGYSILLCLSAIYITISALTLSYTNVN